MNLSNNTAIARVHAREILDSRGNPTVEAEVWTNSHSFGRAAVPSGASTGQHEAVELRDSKHKRFGGKGVRNAVKNIVSTIAPVLQGMDVNDQVAIDRTMINLDGTDNKSKLGANAILAVSLAVARAAAHSRQLSLFRSLGSYHTTILPVPMANILNGGSHADNSVDFQEFMIMPIGAERFSSALQMICEIFQHLKAILKKSGMSTNVGDEGGFAPNLRANEEAIEVILEAIHSAGYVVRRDIMIALDPATSEFYDNEKGKYIFRKSDKRELTSAEMASYWENWSRQYPIISIEDGMAEDDWDGWHRLTQLIGSRVQLVGDDLFVTNTQRLSHGINSGIANSILIKVNQIGTLTETFEAVDMAKRAGYTTIVSHRSGETEDSFIADLVVALESGQIKTGSLSRSDRLAKYNQLLRIEEELGDQAQFAGLNAFNSIDAQSLMK